MSCITWRQKWMAGGVPPGNPDLDPLSLLAWTLRGMGWGWGCCECHSCFLEYATQCGLEAGPAWATCPQTPGSWLLLFPLSFANSSPGPQPPHAPCETGAVCHIPPAGPCLYPLGVKLLIQVTHGNPCPSVVVDFVFKEVVEQYLRTAEIRGFTFQTALNFPLGVGLCY